MEKDNLTGYHSISELNKPDDIHVNMNTNKNPDAITLFKDNLTRNLNTIDTIALILEEKMQNYSKTSCSNDLTKSIFSSIKKQKISIHKYLLRINKYLYIDTTITILTLIYIDRYCNMNKEPLTLFNVHRILFSSLVLANKFYSDFICTNKFYAKVCGVKLSEFNSMEIEMYVKLDFKLFISDKEIKEYIDMVSLYPMKNIKEKLRYFEQFYLTEQALTGF